MYQENEPIEQPFASTNLTETISAEHFLPTVQAAVDGCDALGGKSTT
jgi:hypothetical protein